MDQLRIIAWDLTAWEKYAPDQLDRRRIMIVGSSLVAIGVTNVETQQVVWKANIFRTTELAHANAVERTEHFEASGYKMTSGPFTRLNDQTGLLKGLRMRIKNPGADVVADTVFNATIERGLPLDVAVDPDWVKAYI